jgi:hypothetical protein
MNITFLIPVRLESEDRIENAKICLQYLCKYAPYNIIILENDTESKIPKILSDISTNNASIKYVFQYNKNELFHKTNYLNTMLSMSTTPVVVNYDIDILLPNNIYEYAYNKIIEGYDLFYPYFDGESLIEIKKDAKSKILDNIKDIPNTSISLKIAKYGLCQFLNRNSYMKYGKMNENFYSYGPEDWELGYRFQKLDLKVGWSKNYIFHLEHSRGINSDKNLNPMATHNYNLYEQIKQYSDMELKKYYEIIE